MMKKVFVAVDTDARNRFVAKVLYGDERVTIFDADNELKAKACYLQRKSVIHNSRTGAVLYRTSTGEFVDETNIRNEFDVAIAGLDPVATLEEVDSFIVDLKIGVENLDIDGKLSILYKNVEWTPDEFFTIYV